jgi:hypothetical protein
MFVVCKYEKKQGNDDVRSGIIINDIADTTHEAGLMPVLSDARATLRERCIAPLVCKHGSTVTATTSAHQNHS